MNTYKHTVMYVLTLRSLRLKARVRLHLRYGGNCVHFINHGMFAEDWKHVRFSLDSRLYRLQFILIQTAHLSHHTLTSKDMVWLICLIVHKKLHIWILKKKRNTRTPTGSILMFKSFLTHNSVSSPSLILT